MQRGRGLESRSWGFELEVQGFKVMGLDGFELMCFLCEFEVLMLSS